MKCAKGHNATEIKTAIVDGKFGEYCLPHIKGTYRTAGAHAAQWHRERDHEEHRRDLIQPKDPRTGKVNPEFVRNYPEQSAEMFTPEDMQEALRQT
jgi:hypothetical protein